MKIEYKGKTLWIREFDGTYTDPEEILTFNACPTLEDAIKETARTLNIQWQEALHVCYKPVAKHFKVNEDELYALWVKHHGPTYGLPMQLVPPKEEEGVTITKIQYPDPDGGIMLQARSPAFAILAAECIKLFKETGGVNYVEWRLGCEDPTFGTFKVIIQREAGETPAMQNVRLRAELDQAKKAIRMLLDYPNLKKRVGTEVSGAAAACLPKCPSTYTHSSLGKLECEKDEYHLQRVGDVEHTGGGQVWMSV